MNKRIKELAIEAGIDFLNSIDPEFEKQYCEAWSDEQQKFAELIIAESIEVMKKNDYHGAWLGEKIREHFGIEE